MTANTTDSEPFLFSHRLKEHKLQCVSNIVHSHIRFERPTVFDLFEL